MAIKINIMKLLKMTEFVIGQIKTNSTVNDSFKKDLADVRNYALFLTQPLTLGMFVPCDENGNILEMPKCFLKSGGWNCACSEALMQLCSDNTANYIKAKEKVLFKDCTVKKITDKYTSYFVVYYKSQQIWISWTNRTIEDMIKNNLELTESAIKQIFV